MSACYFTQIQDSHPRNITRHMNDTPPNPIQPLPVPLWRHAFAMLYDTLLVVPLFMAAAAVWVAILGPTQSIDEPAVPAPLQWLTWVVILTSFFGIFWRRAGQTLGMQAWRIQLVSDSAAPLTWQQVIRRVLGALLAALPSDSVTCGATCRHKTVTGTTPGRKHISYCFPSVIRDNGRVHTRPALLVWIAPPARRAAR